jgi:hypothetical protein
MAQGALPGAAQALTWTKDAICETVSVTVA